ncbi:CAP domain-containing protein [Streptomyces sp. YIM 98790]|uniref:CAP domain-containing protein n=1 Tax=Streptomyces sp. YIM 98790 TaxID=2689077 RepID=UPI00140BA1E8|nr:CAP domain-containing protein [Streptomyces sp. YIM 98790]
MGRHRRAPARGTRLRQTPARAGLLGASAALTVGAVAMGAGLVPGAGDRFTLDGPRTFQAQNGNRAGDGSSPAAQGETDQRAVGEESEEQRDRQERQTPADSPEPSEPESESAPETQEAPGEESEEPAPAEEEPEEPAQESSPEAGGETGSPEPSAQPSPSPQPSTPAPGTESPGTTAPPSADPAVAAAEEVLRLVNEARAEAGCRPLVPDTGLAALARAFSQDMAARNFFSHVDPDGRTPWDRAEAQGIKNLGGENIARGQQSAAAVMESWMNSEGHRANILNCDFTTLGVGVHLGPGGPWWTQNFGY